MAILCLEHLIEREQTSRASSLSDLGGRSEARAKSSPFFRSFEAQSLPMSVENALGIVETTQRKRSEKWADFTPPQ